MAMGLRSYIVPTLLALLLHAGIVAVTASTWFDPEPESVRVMPRHIKAELVDLRALQQDKAKAEQEAKRKRDAKKRAEAKKKAERKKREEQARKRKLAEKKKAEQKRLDAKRKAEAKKKAEALAKRKAEQKKREQQQAEQKRQAELKRQAEHAERERLAQEQAQREAAEQAAKAREEAEQAWMARAEQLVASAESVIRDGVSSQWRRPPSARNGMVVGVRIHLLPTGEVDDAYVTQASGDDAFDRSAVNAVLKAERFPELQAIDPLVFDRYLRRITLKFRPEDLRL